MPPCLFVQKYQNKSIFYVACAATSWFLTIQTMIGFMRSNLLAKGVISWYEFHSYAMFWFLTTIVILDVDYFIPVCRRNQDNVPCFGTIFASVRPMLFLPCDHLRNVRTSIIVLTRSEMESSRPGGQFAFSATRQWDRTSYKSSRFSASSSGVIIFFINLRWLKITIFFTHMQEHCIYTPFGFTTQWYCPKGDKAHRYWAPYEIMQIYN